MTYGVLVPLPIFASMLAAGVLSPETQVPLGWVLGGFGVSAAAAWWVRGAQAKLIRKIDSVERIASETAKNFYELERTVKELVREDVKKASGAAASSSPGPEERRNFV